MRCKGKAAVGSGKRSAVVLLYVLAGGITLSGAALAVYSLFYHVTFPVMNTNVSGAVFGIIIVFLGVRYLLALSKLKREVYKPTSRFAWSNYRKSKLKVHDTLKEKG